MANENPKFSMENDLRQTNFKQGYMAYTLFKNMSLLLGAPKLIEDKAWSLWMDLKKSERTDVKENPQGWLACLFYITSLDIRLSSGSSEETENSTNPPFTVTQLLESACISILEFFDHMRTLKDLGYMSEKVQQAYKSLVWKYLVVSPLFNKYEKLFNSIVFSDVIQHYPNSSRNVAEQRFGHTLCMVKDMCWILFLLAKGCLVALRAEFVMNIHLLLCCTDHLVKSSPPFLLQAPFDTAQLQAAATRDHLAILKVLCDQENASFDDVQNIFLNSWQPFLKSLTDKLGSLEVPLLKQYYQDQYCLLGDIDEMKFLEYDPHLFLNRTVAKASLTETVTTPVRAVLNTMQQLKALLAKMKNEPSQVLQQYFADCRCNPSDSILQRIKHLKQRFVEKFIQALGEETLQVAQDRFNSALCLYYRVMEAMLKSEEKRLQIRDFNNLLNYGTFHCCLLACSVEIVIFTYNPYWTSHFMSTPESNGGYLSFPWILDVFELNAFNFMKIIETYIKSEPRLTKDVIKHLQHVENRILEELAWTEDSPVFDVLGQPETGCCNNLSTKHNVLPSFDYLLSSDPIVLSTSNLDQVLRPTKVHYFPHFYNKVFHLAYSRLQNLCRHLEIGEQLLEKIWTCFHEVVFKNSHLLKNRHIDQILLCSIYAICKVSDKDLKFKTIVSEYQSLPHAHSRIYKISPLINFYNTSYTQSMKRFIIQFSSNKTSYPVSPKPKNSPLLTASPVYYKLPGRNNIYISPMKESPFKMPPTSMSPYFSPRSKQLYSFGEFPGSSDKLRDINERVNGFESPTGQKRCYEDDGNSRNILRAQKRLHYDDNESASQQTNIQNLQLTTLPAIAQFLRKKDDSSQLMH